MNHKPFSETVLDELRTHDVQPRARWFFVVRYIFVWIGAGVAGIAAGIAMGTVVYLVSTHDWDVAQYMGRPMFSFIISSIPYVWIVLFALLVVFMYYGIRKTREGYRYETLRLMMVSVLGSVCVGVVLFLGGINAKVHNQLLRDIPWYGDLIYEKHDIWIHPEQGLLGGVIEGTSTDGFMMRDEENAQWRIVVSTTTVYQDHMQPVPGDEVKIIGAREATSTFDARRISSWGE